MTDQANKQLDMEAMVASLKSSDVIGFGGGGLTRKPMAAAAAIGRSSLEGLDIASFLGGPEVDLLIGLGKVKRLRFCFVGFDAFGLAPNFRLARQRGEIEAVEYSEGLMLAAYEAAAKRLPFIPSRFGMGTAIVDTPTSPFKQFACPVSGEQLLAVPALAPDVAIVHVNEVDKAGNALIHGDSFLDLLLMQAAGRVILTAEKVVDEIPGERRARSTFISRLWVDNYVVAPGGGGFSAVYPDYRFDLPKVFEYQKNATDRSWLAQHIGSAQ